MLRCLPSVSHPSLEKFDALLKQAIQRITNSDLYDLQWIQASLPVRDGGLGVRPVSSLALPAFLASAASAQSLQDDILTDCVQSSLYTFVPISTKIYVITCSLITACTVVQAVV